MAALGPTGAKEVFVVHTRSKIAFWCYVVAMVGPAVWGVMFLLRSDFMPYHAVAVGMPWSDVPGPFRVLIMALLKLAGGGWLTVAVAEFVLLLVPFRQGARWALWTVPCLGLLPFAGVCNAMAHVTLNTPATPPWGATIASIALILIGAVLSIPAPAKSRGA
jgi:hypothetical protein